tara:strand:+ start:1158 stop:1424 length:267 start_codon:yes stop_codon:yes gene_type:complete
MSEKITNDEAVAVRTLFNMMFKVDTDHGQAAIALIAALDGASQGVVGGHMDISNKESIATVLRNPDCIKVISRMLYSGITLEAALERI